MILTLPLSLYKFFCSNPAYPNAWDLMWNDYVPVVVCFADFSEAFSLIPHSYFLVSRQISRSHMGQVIKSLDSQRYHSSDESWRSPQGFDEGDDHFGELARFMYTPTSRCIIKHNVKINHYDNS